MMEKLEAPQTHIGLKAMIAEIDEDNDGKISFNEFLLIFKWVSDLIRMNQLFTNYSSYYRKCRKARAGELDEGSGLSQLAQLTSIDVEEVGVVGAKCFFEAKIEQQHSTNKFADEIRREQMERRQEEIERDLRRQQFQERAAMFGKN